MGGESAGHGLNDRACPLAVVRRLNAAARIGVPSVGPRQRAGEAAICTVGPESLWWRVATLSPIEEGDTDMDRYLPHSLTANPSRP